MKTSECNDAVRHAFNSTPLNHLLKTFEMRNPGPEQVGSMFEVEQDVHSLMNADWEPLEHENILPGCRAFKTKIAGFVGVVDLTTLDPKMTVRLVDKKGAIGTYGGGVQAEVSGVDGWQPPGTDTTIIILGPHEGKEAVFTFHPGMPVKLAEVDDKKLVGLLTTVEDALRFGLTTAKVAKVGG